VDSAALTEQAREDTGLDRWGGDSFRAGLAQLVQALNTEADLSPLGEVAVAEQILGNLRNRLRVTAWVDEHPELLEEPVERPIIVLGLPRTGTTLLHELFHRDPANRSLMRWEAVDSVPPPDAAHFGDDPRVDLARAASEMMDALNPEFQAIHYEAPDGPTECVAVLSQDFRSLLWSVVANVPSYTRWLLDADATPAYDYHHRVLQLLQSRAPGRWALKTPHHALFLDTVTGRYPDARLVMTHRDPVTVVASLCSLAATLSGTFSDVDHRDDQVSTWMAVGETLVERVMDFRDRGGDDRFVDVAYGDLVADPIDTVVRILGHYGETLSPAAATSMRAYLAADPHPRLGRHQYSPEATGIDADDIGRRFARYSDRFAIRRP
jgi:Sulfotransferase family